MVTIIHVLVPSDAQDISVISDRNLFLQEFYQLHSDFGRFVSPKHVGNELGRDLHLHLQIHQTTKLTHKTENTTYHLKSTPYHSAEHVAEPQSTLQSFVWEFDKLRKRVIIEGQRKHRTGTCTRLWFRRWRGRLLLLGMGDVRRDVQERFESNLGRWN
jgi:hypothetical protein